MPDKQIKSKDRVAEHGEVYTAEREVNAMLDLVKNETERIESRFLEPACGNGNFLAEILKRKLTGVRRMYGKSRSEYEKYSVIAITSIYGVDILEDNVQECIARLFEVLFNEYKAVCKDEVLSDCEDAVMYILQHNILCGNALSMLKVDSEGKDTDEPIIFAQWDLTTGDMVKRRDYRLDELMKAKNEQMDMDMLLNGWEYDEEIKSWIPSPIKEYPPTSYWEVQNA